MAKFPQAFFQVRACGADALCNNQGRLKHPSFSEPIMATMQLAEPLPNRRAALRRQPTVGTICRVALEAHEAPRMGLVWNISTSGVSMFLDEPPQLGVTLPAVITTMDEQQTLPVRLRVMHVRPIRTGDFFLGAQFERPLETGEMRPFLAEPQMAS
jgi:hypothetical protein